MKKGQNISNCTNLGSKNAVLKC